MAQTSGKPRSVSPLVHIIRHGQALHNVDPDYPYRDPPLTEVGHSTTKAIKTPTAPDLIIISPMTRTIQTALNAFPTLIHTVDVQIWPELREISDDPCNKGLSRAGIARKYPQFDFSSCHKEWDYPPHSLQRALERAEVVRKRLKTLSKKYSSIAVVTHRRFITYLVKGKKFLNCATHTYRFARDNEVEKKRMGVNCDCQDAQDFGPTLLLPYDKDNPTAKRQSPPTRPNIRIKDDRTAKQQGSSTRQKGQKKTKAKEDARTSKDHWGGCICS